MVVPGLMKFLRIIKFGKNRGVNMKQCKDYEDAFYYDCLNCDEDCKYRKEYSFLNPIMIYLIIFIAIILLLL